MIRNCSEMNVQECWMPFYTLFQLISAHKVLGSYDLFPSYSILNMYIQIMISKELHELLLHVQNIWINRHKIFTTANPIDTFESGRTVGVKITNIY